MPISVLILTVLIGITLVVGFPIYASLISVPILVVKKALKTIRGEIVDLEESLEEAKIGFEPEEL